MTRQFDQVAGDGRYLSPVADARITDLGPAVLRPARAPLTSVLLCCGRPGHH